MALVTIGAGGLAAGANAYVYWASGAGLTGTTIGRANLDGTDLDETFISGASNPQGVAVNGDHLYWANNLGTTIGRANLDGTGVDHDFITGAIDPLAIAVDDQYVFWTNSSDPDFTIGRATVDGSDVDQNFIPAASGSALTGLAIGGGYVYWSNLAGRNLSSYGSIGRAKLNGTDVDQKFITGVDFPEGLAVDGPYIYWANSGAGTIGRAKLGGSEVNQSFITDTDDPRGVAVDGQRIYWTNYEDNSIGRAKLNGTHPDKSFITGAQSPSAVAVDCPAPSGQLSGTRVGPVTLGVTQPALRQSLPDYNVIGYGFDDFCLYGGFGIRAGYPSAKLLRGVSAAQRTRITNRVVIAMTANRRYALDGVKAGARLATAARKVRFLATFHIGLNHWYLVRGPASTGVLKVRHGGVLEVGIADRRLTQGQSAQRRLLTSFGAI